MRIAVVGAGGTGGFFGGLLARAGEDVTFIARGSHLGAIQDRGLTVKSRFVGDFTVKARATDDPVEVGPVDVVLFCVKAYDTETAAARMRPLVGPGTVVLPVQNGIDSAERIGRLVTPDAVIGGVAVVSAVIETPGVIDHRSVANRIQFGELAGGTSPRTERLLPVLRQAGIKAELRVDIRVALWEKFVQICAFSGLTALTRLPLGPLRSCPETHELFRGTLQEVDAVGRAEGVALPADTVEAAMALFASGPPDLRGSLYYDLAAERRLEVDTLNGTAVRLGRARGVPTPLNFAIYAALKPYAAGAPASS
jgi:2-dehydropantoate 2-reductase